MWRVAGAVLWLLGTLLAVEGQGPRVLAHTVVENPQRPFLAEGSLVVVNTTLLNVGDETAFGVWIDIPEWPVNDMDLVSGDVNHTQPQLRPGETYRHSFVVRPKRSLALDLSATTQILQYTATPHGGPIIQGITPGTTHKVISASRYRYLTASYLREWTHFALLVAATCGSPLTIWLTTRTTVKAHHKKLSQS